MEEIEFRHEKSYERMKMLWNGPKQGYYSISECKGIEVRDKDANGFNIYGRAEAPIVEKKKGGLLR